MAFLTLNGVTVPCRSDAATEDREEYGLDRDRMFDGTLRVSRRGLFRHWVVQTTLMSESDANTLLALVNTNSPPLTASGDLVGDDVAVMPIPGHNDPVQWAGGFKRRLTFELKETGGALPADTTANVFLFLRAGVRLFSDDGGTIAAGAGDPVGNWADATGNGRFVHRYFSDSFRPHWDGSAVHFDESGDATFGAALIFGGSTGSGTIHDWNALTSAEIMASLKADVFPPVASTKGAVWWLGGETGGAQSYYTKTDSHLYGGFGVGNISGVPYDDSLVADDLSAAYHVFGESSDAASYKAYLDNVLVKTALIADGHTVSFDTLTPTIGHGNAGINDHWLGRIKHLLITNGVMTASQRRSWYDFMRGAVADPPLP